MTDNNHKAVIQYQEPTRPALGARDELQVQDVVMQVQKILQIKQAVMKEHEHYGVVPGTQKPTLFKAGAEKLAMTFRFAPKFTITVSPLTGEHREYSCACSLTHIHSGNLIAEGVGSCNTMEGKYRYRKADPESVGPVPKNYWTEKNEAKKSDIIGGRGFGVKKIGGNWMIVKYSDEKIEHGNPADFYNTCLKMAKKRAFVDAVITATGGSDIFMQDLEDFQDIEVSTPEPAPTPTTPPKNGKPSPVKPSPVKNEAPAYEEPPDWPEEPREVVTPTATPTTATPQPTTSPAPAGNSKGTLDFASYIDEWRAKAIEADPKMGAIRFDGVLKAQLKLHRVESFSQLSRQGQEQVVNAMRMVAEGMMPMPGAGKKPSKLADKFQAIAESAMANV